MGGDVQVEAAQDHVVAEALDDPLGGEHRGGRVGIGERDAGAAGSGGPRRAPGGACAGDLGSGGRGDPCAVGLGGHQTVPPICSRLRSFAVYQSERRMKGKDMMMKRTPATT